MRIAFLNRYQNKAERGAEVFVNELAGRLSESNEVEVFSGKKADSIKDIINGKFDIVVPLNGRLQSLKVSLARIIGGYKLLITGHSGIGRDDIWNLVIAKPDVFVALTDHMAKWAKRWAWGSKIIKIPNGVDLNKFSPKGEKIKLSLKKPIILSVGALVWYKHHERVIRTVREMGGGSVFIVGEGSEKERLKRLGSKLLGERFRIASFKYEDMPKVYRSCDLFTLPSWDREAFGIVYLEALASGLGVVAPDDKARREIVGEGGLFTDVNDPIKYAKTIREALNADWSKKARVQAEKFSWERVALEYEKLIFDMVG